MNETQRQDRETYLFWENHYRLLGDDANANICLRLANDIYKPKAKKSRDTSFTPASKYIPIYEDVANSTSLEGLAEIIELCPESTEVWMPAELKDQVKLYKVLFAGQTEPVNRYILNSAIPTKKVYSPRIQRTPSDRKALRAARRAARRAAQGKAPAAPRISRTPEERQAAKKILKAERLALLKAMLSIPAYTPKSKSKKAKIQPTPFSIELVLDKAYQIASHNPEGSTDLDEAYTHAIQDTEQPMSPATSLKQLKQLKKAFRNEFHRHIGNR